MSTTTTNLALTKPAASDNVSINVLNTNFDTIDSAIGTLEYSLESISVNLTVSGWSSSAPYTQTVTVQGMTSDWVPGAPTYNFGNAEPTAEQLEAALEEMAKIKMIVSNTNQLKFVAPSDKPTAAVPMIVPGQKVRS